MFRYFEHLIDPYQAYDESAEIPDRLIPFLRRFLWPARWVIGIGMTLGLIAALTEAALVAFAARLIDLLSTTAPDRLWADHGGTLMLMLAVALVIAAGGGHRLDAGHRPGLLPAYGRADPLADAPQDAAPVAQLLHRRFLGPDRQQADPAGAGHQRLGLPGDGCDLVRADLRDRLGRRARRRPTSGC